MATRRRLNGKVRGNQKIPAELTLARESRAWTLRARGFTLQETAAALATEFGTPISIRGLTKALARVAKDYATQAVAALDEHKGRQLAALEAIYEDAMASFRQSRGEVTRTRHRSEQVGSRGKKHRVVTIDTEHRAGDPRFLATALDALRDQRRLLGLDAPLKVQPTDAPERELTPDQLDDRIRTLAAYVTDAEARAAAARVH